jgi:hypothetical protein
MTMRIVAAFVVWVSLFIPVNASTLQVLDAHRFQLLRTKLHAATVDVSDAAAQAGNAQDYATVNCLITIHDQGNEIESTAAAIGDLIALSVLMKDSEDEGYVLRALRTWLVVLNVELPQARQIINGEMIQCSHSAVANTKGQALLNVLSEWNDPVAMLSRRVVKPK